MKVTQISGGLHKVLPLDVEPSIRLIRWRVFEVTAARNDWHNTRHFVGWSLDGHEGRVSNVIQSFDMAARRGVTARGRIYTLIGDPGHDMDGDYVWNAFRKINGITEFVDVSKEYVHDDKAVAPMSPDGDCPPASSADGGVDR